MSQSHVTVTVTLLVILLLLARLVLLLVLPGGTKLYIYYTVLVCYRYSYYKLLYWLLVVVSLARPVMVQVQYGTSTVPVLVVLYSLVLARLLLAGS
jgi:hypothetical protein